MVALKDTQGTATDYRLVTSDLRAATRWLSGLGLDPFDDLQSLHLRHRGDQNVSSFRLGQFHRCHPNVLLFQPQLLVSMSVKFK